MAVPFNEFSKLLCLNLTSESCFQSLSCSTHGLLLQIHHPPTPPQSCFSQFWILSSSLNVWISYIFFAQNTHHPLLPWLALLLGSQLQYHFSDFLAQFRNVAMSFHSTLDVHDHNSYHVFKNSSVTCHCFQDEVQICLST